MDWLKKISIGVVVGALSTFLFFYPKITRVEGKLDIAIEQVKGLDAKVHSLTLALMGQGELPHGPVKE